VIFDGFVADFDGVAEFVAIKVLAINEGVAVIVDGVVANFLTRCRADGKTQNNNYGHPSGHD
jgi:hypothetical protein